MIILLNMNPLGRAALDASVFVKSLSPEKEE
jgi:hypothetical protein